MTTAHPHQSMTDSRPRGRRLVSALACAFVALISTLAWPASPAQAHDDLRSSTPSAGARLTAAPQQVRLVFSDEVEPGFTTVALRVAAGAPMTLTAREDGSLVTASVPSTANSGAAAGGPVGWKLEYRVVSSDGHPVSGSVSFSVASAGAGSASAPSATPVPTSSPPGPAASPTPQSASAASGDTPAPDDQRPIPLMLLVGGLIVVGIASAVWLTRAKPDDGR